MQTILPQRMEQLLDQTDWPQWLESTAVFAVQLGQVAALVFLGWIASYFIGLAIRRFANRFSSQDSLDGTIWDLMASLVRFVLIAISLLIGLQWLGLSTLPLVSQYGGPALRAAIILVLAWLLAGRVAKGIADFGNRVKQGRHGDNTLFAFLSSVSKYSLIAIAAVVALQQFGAITSLTAIIGAGALAIGLALQDTLKAVAGGVMLATFRPYRIGDWVELDGHDGEVIQITPFTTTLVGVDNRTVVVPNTLAWGQTLINYTGQRRRRLDLILDISYDDDIDFVFEVLNDVFRAENRVIGSEPVWFGVHGFASSSVQIRARGWCATSDYFQLRSDILKAVKHAFDENGITIPYPQQVEMSPFELERWQAHKHGKLSQTDGKGEEIPNEGDN